MLLNPQSAWQQESKQISPTYKLLDVVFGFALLDIVPENLVPSGIYNRLSLTAKKIIAKDLPPEDHKILIQGFTSPDTLQAHLHKTRQVFAARESQDSISSLTTETSPLSKSSSSRSSSNWPSATAHKILKNSSDSGKPSKSHLGPGHPACSMADNKAP